MREGLARGVRETVLRPVLALQRGAVERHARFDDPDRLRAERDSLAAYLIGQSALSTENRELRELLGLRQKLPQSFVPAEVVRIPGRGAEGFFQLTGGADQGIRSGAPIVAPSGLVGRVRTVDGRTAFGIDWMHPEFAASAMTLDGQVYGIVKPTVGPGGEPMLVLTGTPRHVQLRAGTVLVTSGHGGVFPRGVPIGTVTGVEGRGTSWQRNYLVRPAVSPSEMTYVLVLGPPQAEGADAEFPADLAQAWGIRASEIAIDTAAAAAAEAAARAQPSAGGAAPPAPGGAAPRPAAPPANPEPAPAEEPLLGEPLPPGDNND